MEERLKRRTKVELFEQMRREYAHGVGTITGVVKKFGVHRRMVRDALASAVPADRKQPERESPKLDRVKGLIDAILMEDRKAPRKQRHTAHRIFNRIEKEIPDWQVGESTVRRYVRGNYEWIDGLPYRRTLPHRHLPTGQLSAVGKCHGSRCKYGRHSHQCR